MQGEWIRKPTSRTSVIFVHGVLSSGETCWRNANGSYWPELLSNAQELDELGIYVFTYQTGVFSGTYRLGDVVDALKEHMRLDGLFDSKRLIFVCHSMGGIVVRKFLVERDTDLIEGNLEVGLFLVASPSLGSSYANWLSPLAKVMGHAQADALRFAQDNAWLNDVDKEFQNVKEGSRLRIKRKELIEDKFVVLRNFWRKQVVEPFSDARYFGEPYKVPQADHFSIAKPDNSRAIQHRLLCQFIKEMVSGGVQTNRAQELVNPDQRQPQVLGHVNSIPAAIENPAPGAPEKGARRCNHTRGTPGLYQLRPRRRNA
ncbi:MAG: esterase/lipase family protein [Gammaproteobacteria bacterium]